MHKINGIVGILVDPAMPLIFLSFQTPLCTSTVSFCAQKNPKPFDLEFKFKIYAGDRNRTGTSVTTRRILSPVRLPVPPRRRECFRIPRPEWDSNPRPPP